MAKYPGRLVKLGLAKEASRGAGAAPTYLVPHVTFSVDDKVVKARSDAGLGRLEDSEEAFVTTKYAEGELSGEVRAKSFGLLLYSMLGTLSTSGPTDSSYTHSFSLAQSAQHQSLALLVEDSNTTEMHRLLALNSLELTQNLDEVLMYSANFMAKQAVTSGQSAPSLADEPKFTKSHLSLKIAAAVGDLAAASAISVKSLTMTINKNVVLDDVLGTAEPEDILNKAISVEGEIVLNYEAETYKNYMLDGDHKAMEIAWTNTDETLGGGSTNPSLTFQMPRVDFFDWQPDYSLDEIVSQTVSFKASYDISGSNDIISTCDLVNAVTSY